MTPGLVDEFLAAATRDDDEVAPAALLMARVAYPDLDPGPHLATLEQMGATARDHLRIGLGGMPPLRTRVRVITEYVYGQLGFTGNEEHYDDPRNSLLNDVLASRTGIPITLAVVFISVARAAGLAAEGVNFPGHFLVRCQPDAADGPDSRAIIIDPFAAGTPLGDADCRRLLERHAGAEVSLEPEMLRSAGKRDILLRMLLNLKRAYVRLRSFAQARAVTDLLVALEPGALGELRDRGLLASQMGELASALRDLEAWLRLSSATGQPDADHAQVWKHVLELRRRIAGMN